MATVKFTSLLQRFHPDLNTIELEGNTVKEVLDLLEAKHPGLTDYLLEDQGELRKHVNIFVDGAMISDRDFQSDAVNSQSEIFILQALSGG